VTEIIFIPPANSPDVRKFSELDIHRIVLGRAVHPGNSATNGRRCRLKPSVH
jgi:hypothetical protein